MAQPTEVQNMMYFYLQHGGTQRYETSVENLGNVVLSNTSKDAAIELDEQQLRIRGGYGYRTILATHGVSCGTYYYEVEFEKVNSDSHIRAGFSLYNCHLDGPVGYDPHSYALRSVDCTVCTDRMRLTQPSAGIDAQRFAVAQISTGTVISFLIHLPVEEPPFDLPEEAEMCVTRSSFSFGRKQAALGEGELSDLDYVPYTVVELPEVPVPGSFIKFFVDGYCVAQVNGLIYQRYYPAISLFNFGRATVNFGRRNTRIPGYPPEFYCLPGTLVYRSGEYTIYGLGGCKVEFVSATEKNSQSRVFSTFIQSQGEAVYRYQRVEVEESSNLGYKFYNAEAMGQIQEFRDLYMIRSTREGTTIMDRLKSGEFSIELYKEIAKYYHEAKKAVKKLKK